MKNNLYKIFYRRKASAGFTLIELLAAMAITSIVISVTGFGVVALTDKNSKERAETEKRVELNRAQDFISDEVRMAIDVNDSASKPEWAIDNDKADLSNQSKDWINKLGGGSPEAKLFLQIPLNVDAIDGSADEIDIEKHGFSAGNAVMFTGSGITAAGLEPNVVYYITGTSTDHFQVSTSLAGTAVNVNAVSPGSLTVNRLLIYYIRGNTDTWLGPKTVNRSAGPCVRPYQDTNCPVLVDSIAEDGFTARAISSRKAEINLRGALDDNASKDLKVSNNAFARLFETLGGADKDADAADKAAKDAKDAADKAAADKAAADKAAKEAEDAANKTAADKAAADKAAKEAEDAANKTAADKAAKDAKDAADKAAVDKAAADKAAKDAKDAADKAAEEQAAADKAAKDAKDAADKAAKDAKDAADKAAAEQAAREAQAAADKAAADKAAAEQAAREAQAAADRAAADKAAAEQSAREAQAAADKKAAEEKAAADKAAADKAAADKAAEEKAAADKAAADARTATNRIFTTQDGVITFTRSATGTFRIIGGDAGGIPTSTTINKTEGNKNTNTSVTASNRDFNVSGAAGTTLTVTGSATSFTYQGIRYGGFNANSNTNKDTQVWALRNNDPLPPFTPYPGQVPPANYLKAAGYLDANGKIKLAENQVIYLFEVTTTNKTRSDYDMQDIIVLATIR